MDPKLLDVSERTMPKFNAEICDGFHQREFDQIEKFYERLLRMTFEPLASKGVFFRGMRMVRPEEMFKVVSESTQNKTFEINKESLYPCRLSVGFKDATGNERIIDNIYQMLPFTDRYGDVWIRGSRYSLQIVMADRGLSVTRDEQIFVKVLGYKFKIGAENMELVRIHHDITPPMYKNIPLNLSANRFYSASKAFEVNDNRTPKPLLAWYMFAVYGFSKTMNDFAECEYRIGELNAVMGACPASEGWQVYGSSGKRNDKLITAYLDTGLAIAVRSTDSKRRDEELPTATLQYVGALIYLFDVAPALVDLDELDNSRFWQLIIGRCSMINKNGDESILKQMDDHFDSLSERLDPGSIKRFASQNIMVKNMFELFNHIIGTRTEFVKTFDRGQMLNKELCSLEYTIDRLISAATRFKHDVKNTTDLSYEKVRSYLTNHFRIRDVEKAAWESNMVQESTPTDCPLVDYVLGVMPQTKITMTGRQRAGGDFNPNDSANSAHASLLFAMSGERVTKPDPDGRGYLGPCVSTNSGKIIVLPDYLRSYYNATVKRLTVIEIKPYE